MDQQAHLVYEFGEFRLDALRRVLSSRVDGQPLQVTAKVFDTLLHFVEHAGQILDKRALMEALWPNVVVEESNLTQTIHTLRRALGERPDEHRFIVTVPGRGYRFVADVKVRADAGRELAAMQGKVDRVPPRRWRLLTLATASLAVIGGLLFFFLRPAETPRAPPHLPKPSIAVLPFVDMSPEGDQEYFSDGLSEEILNMLAQSAALQVIARTSSFAFKGQNVDIATIADKLHVEHVLEGSVRKAGNRVRITAQLVEARNSSHVWSQTYERDLDDAFVVQTEIATAVAEALHSRLGSNARVTHGPKNAQAYEQLLRGNFFFGRRGPGDLDRAMSAYQRALEIDPEYARAWAGVAAVASVQTGDGLVPREAGLETLEHAARKAIAYDPQLAEGYVRLALYYWLIQEDKVARQYFDKGASLNPESPLVLGIRAGQAAESDRLDEAIELARRAISIDPLSALSVGNLGAFLLAAGRLDEAKVEFLKALELRSDMGDAGSIGIILVLQGELDAALTFIERSTQGGQREQGLALVYHALGRTADADAALERLIAVSGTSDPFSVAEVYAYRGNSVEAFKWLELAMRPTDPKIGLYPGKRFVWEMQASPLLQSLHADPRWKTWLASTG